MSSGYVGRFAPSPTGPLHAGSVVAALGSWLDARAHRGRWLVRIEDLDPPREVPGAAAVILSTLARLGLSADASPQLQSTRTALYADALDQLVAEGLAYPCGCTRREIADSQLAVGPGSPSGERVYPGTCRHGLPAGRTARAWRLRVPADRIEFTDRLQGPQQQNLAAEVGDFVLKRADGLWAYQLAVVVDDAAQGITDVVRGADLLGSTARQIALARALRRSSPRWLHLPVVRAECGDKLSKQTGAAAIDASRPLTVLGEAMRHLGFEPPTARDAQTWLSEATLRWALRFGPHEGPTSGFRAS